MAFNFFKDYFKPKAYFEHKPNLIFEYEEEGEKYYSMDSDLIFCTGKMIEGEKEKIIIKAIDESGAIFYSNLASIPKWLTWLIKPDRDKLKYAALLHDGLYGALTLGKRVYDDWIFLLALKVEEENIFIRWGAFLAVRVAGSSYR